MYSGQSQSRNWSDARGQLELKGTGTDTVGAGHHLLSFLGVFNHSPPSSQANTPISVSHQVTNEGGREGTRRTLQHSVDTREAPALQSKKRWIFFFGICIALPEPLRATACDIHTWLVPFAKSQSPALQQEQGTDFLPLIFPKLQTPTGERG